LNSSASPTASAIVSNKSGSHQKETQQMRDKAPPDAPCSTTQQISAHEERIHEDVNEFSTRENKEMPTL